MLRVSAAEPCRGRGSSYEVWMHTVAPNAPHLAPHLVKVALTGDCADIDNEVGLTETPGPQQVLDMLQRYTVRTGEGRVFRDQLATVSLIRLCNRATHVSGKPSWTGKGTVRPEAAARMVLAPPGTGGKLPAMRITRRVDFNDQNVGVLSIPGESTALRRHIVTVPTTIGEVGMKDQRAVPVALTAEPALATFALLHLREDGTGPIERVIASASENGLAAE